MQPGDKPQKSPLTTPQTPIPSKRSTGIEGDTDLDALVRVLQMLSDADGARVLGYAEGLSERDVR